MKTKPTWKRVTASEVKQISELLKSACAWASKSMPKDAIIHHLGHSSAAGDFVLGFTVKSLTNAVVTVYLRSDTQRWAESIKMKPDAFLSEDEVEVIRNALPVESVSEWNGAGTDGVSFVIPCEWHLTASAAHTTNYRGCPKEGDCQEQGKNEATPVFCECQERRDAYARATSPEGWG